MSNKINELVDDLAHGRMSRRDFIKRAAVLGLSLSSISAILAACGGSSATPEATETAAATGTAAATETAAATGTAAGGAPSGDPIKLGGIYNMTGSQSSLDVPSSECGKLAVKEINAAGGLLGRPVEFIVQDGKSDVTTCTNVTTQMVEVDKVVALTGVSDTNYALPIGQIAQSSKIPFITSGATAPSIPDLTGDYVFLGCFGDNVSGAACAEYSYANLGKSAWLLIDNGMDYTKFLAQYFQTRYEELGGTIAATDFYQTGDTDYSSQITKLKSLSPQPEVLFVSAGPNECGTIVKQLRDAGVTGPVVSADGFDTPLLVELGGSGATNIYFVTHMGLAGETARAKTFKAAYKAEYGKDLESVFGALAYDSVYLLANAITTANSVDPTAIRDALAATKGYEGATGTITYPEGSRVPQKSLALVKVTDGKLTFEQEVTPEKIPPA